MTGSLLDRKASRPTPQTGTAVRTDRILLLEYAREAGLSAVVPDRRCQEFMRTGILPSGCAAANDLARSARQELARHPAFRGLAVGPVRGAADAERADYLLTGDLQHFPRFC
jgi:hypothetical protein